MWLSFAQSYRYISFQATWVIHDYSQKRAIIWNVGNRNGLFFLISIFVLLYIGAGLEVLYWVKLVFLVNCIYSCCAVRDISESALVSWGNFTFSYCLWTRLNRPLTKKPWQVPTCPGTVLGLQHNCWRFKMSSVVFLVLLLWFFKKYVKWESCRRAAKVSRWKHQLYYLLRATTYEKQAPLCQSTIDSLLRDTKKQGWK